MAAWLVAALMSVLLHVAMAAPSEEFSCLNHNLLIQQGREEAMPSRFTYQQTWTTEYLCKLMTAHLKVKKFKRPEEFRLECIDTMGPDCTRECTNLSFYYDLTDYTVYPPFWGLRRPAAISHAQCMKCLEKGQCWKKIP
eukprot:GILK01013796.1.p1 GENE.GILK01013796.1~~GILK01013796.1.p1  ORF type:complete len:152 (+),score=15.90 GILK01013796.1:40-456(+)